MKVKIILLIERMEVWILTANSLYLNPIESFFLEKNRIFLASKIHILVWIMKLFYTN